MSTVDPRPFTYQYRKTRLTPTYQSHKLYQSIYHLGNYAHRNDYLTRQQQLINNGKYVPKEQPNIPRQYSMQHNPSMQQQSNHLEKSESVNKMPNNRKQQQQHKQQQYKQQQYKQQQYKQQQSKEQQYQQQQLKSLRDSHERQLKQLPSRGSNQQPSSSGRNSILSNYGSNLMYSSNFQRFQVYERQQKPYNIINCYPNQQRPILKQFPKLTQQDMLIEKGSSPYSRMYNPQK